MKNLKTLIFLVLFGTSYMVFSQIKDQLEIDLNDVITLSEKNSLDAFKAKHLYQSSILEFRNFQVENLPILNMNLNPLVYNSSIVERYDANLNRDVFRTVETLNSYLGLSVSQNITATGGNVFLRSNINRLQNSGTISNIAYNNNIIQLGFNQSLFSFNSLKWNKKTAPLVYEKAKIEFIEARESIHIKAVNFFFDLASAQLNYEISKDNFENANQLYEIGKERFKIATINQEELLNLELNLLNAEVAQKRAVNTLKDSQFSINTFLGNAGHLDYKLVIPETIFKTEMDFPSALKQAQENNSEILDMKLKELNSLKEFDRIKRQGRFNPTFSGIIGLNKNAENYSDSYINPLTQKQFSLRVTIPIIDWGTANRRTEVAANRNKIVIAENKQSIEDFKQKIMTQIGEFNLQSELVEKALRSKDIAIKAHELVLERFKFGNIDIVKLNASRTAKDRAINDYLNSLNDYWNNYYTIQKLTLIDLKTNQKLSLVMDKQLDIEK